MGWQDRDYAAGHSPVRPVWSTGPSRASGGRSIVTTLIVINVVIFVLEELFPSVSTLLQGRQGRNLFGGLAIQSGIAELRADLVMHGQIWRLVTAQYLHGGLGHVFINMLVLHFLGRSLEQMWSARKFFGVYTACGVCGNVFYTILAWQGVIPTWMPAVGASGCIYGLLGVVAVLFPHATVYIYFLFPIKIRTAAFIFGGIALLRVITGGENFGGEACHLAGLVFGVWWAMKGDAWWSSTGWHLPRVLSRAQAPKVRDFSARVEQRREDAETIDRILKKVYEGGIHSLSEREKRTLQDATERQRARDRDAGRIDRL